MRDPKRIPIVLAEIQKFWENHPDWRFGQIMFNLFGAGDHFHMPDDHTLKVFQAANEEYKKN